MMQLHSNVSLEEGHRNLYKIIKEIGDTHVDWNEANTRFHIIDRLLIECLGWPKEPEIFKVEVHTDGEYRDYVLGSPEAIVWEAKRSGAYFDFPVDVHKKIDQSIEGIFAVSKTAEAAIRQVQGYCNSSGIEFAVVCNGHQLIALPAVRIGQSWLKGRALCIRSLQHFNEEFPTVWQCLSPDGLAAKRLSLLLTTGSTRTIPRKLSTQLREFPAFRYKTDLQTNLRAVSELLLEDIVSTEALRPQFYRECYCETGALSRDALVSQQILETRYAALFAAAEAAPRLEPAAKQGDTPSLSNQILTEALAKRPIVLLGDVGVGKTSFLEELIYVRAEKEFARAVYIYIDLGSKAALAVDIRKFVVDELERQLYAKYQVDIYEHNFVRAVYDLEVKRFRSSFKAIFYKSNRAKLDDQMAARIDELINDKSEHLRRSLQHVARGRQRQIVIIIDNADQRAIEVQQAAFIIAHEFAQNWDALVFIPVRPQTFFQSKRAGTLAAYPHKVFTILPPRPELVIEKRLIFALKVAEGRIAPDALQGVRLMLGSMAVFLRALLYSMEKNRDITEILANITGGNIRAVVEFVRQFIGSPNVEAEKIVDIHGKTGNYIIPLHEFSKAAILGDYSHFVPESSLAMNVFDVESPDRREHFLSLMIVAFLLSDESPKDRDGFVCTALIIEEMQNWRFLPEQVEKALRKVTNKRLIETTERITFEEDLVGLIGSMLEGFRQTSVGAYHVRRWAGDFAYLDGMVFDTPIFDPEVREGMSDNLGSFDIQHRYARTLMFRNYLSVTWESSGLRPQYLDWNETVRYGQSNFDVVHRAISKIVEARTSARFEHRRG
jgi:predicted type IV restriction endonuclease